MKPIEVFNDEELRAELDRIESAASRILNATRKRREKYPELNNPELNKGAINWCDLRVAQTALVVTKDNYYFEVVIEEANSFELASCVHDRLEQEGFDNVAVRTEW